MKPKYRFFDNAKFALQGLCAMFQSEVAFKIELCIIVPAMILSFFLPVSLTLHLLLVAVLMLILIAEAFNSALESCVDLITDEWHFLAKKAKDCASAGVFLCVCLAIFAWVAVLVHLWLENEA